MRANDLDVQAEQLDISKPKATELLRAHDSDAVRAMKAWVTASV
jgi:NACalpha-BTF3-like transcription factor